MERTLSLVLDNDGFVSLTLKKGDSLTLDKFTTGFENSDEIRNFFKEEIEQYLQKNESYIKEYERIYKRKNNGRIVLLEPYNYGTKLYLRRQAVLYKKHVKCLDHLIKYKKVMQRFLELDKVRANELKVNSLVSIALQNNIKFSSFKTKADINRIKMYLKRDENFYEKLRLIVKAYKENKKNLNLPKIENIYCKIKKNNSYVKSTPNITIDNEMPDIVLINGQRYKSDDIPTIYDLDNRYDLETEYHPDGLGPKK